ncbi:hypothetical protein Rhal01_02878 [Rubritalea halochordaticola]|uniref:Uncharacterized protein n=1 Tax=Rubritalea halochordaticola TaxID=714537 RepID=A0ABP9V2E4_9BACT
MAMIVIRMTKLGDMTKGERIMLLVERGGGSKPDKNIIIA